MVERILGCDVKLQVVAARERSWSFQVFHLHKTQALLSTRLFQRLTNQRRTLQQARGVALNQVGWNVE